MISKAQKMHLGYNDCKQATDLWFQISKENVLFKEFSFFNMLNILLILNWEHPYFLFILMFVLELPFCFRNNDFCNS